jgi:hypothetical protein
MNEEQVAARFRALDDGSEPDAPVALRRFVRERAFVVAAVRPAGASVPARAHGFGRVAFGIAAAVVLIAGATLWLSLRGPSTGIGVTPGEAATPSQEASPSVAPTPTQPSPTSPTISTVVWKKGDSWNPDGPQPPLPTFGLPVPGGGYFGSCQVGQSHADWPYIGYPFCTSPDGLRWTISTDPRFKGIVLAAAAKGNGEYVMVGSAMATGQAVVFRSSDAVNWTRAADADVAQKGLILNASAGTGEHGLTPMGAVVWGPKGFVAAGWHDAWQQSPNPPAVEWHSTDGVKWTAEVPPAGGYTYLYSIGSRYFLSGTWNTGGDFPLWYSSDGVSWQRATADAAGDPILAMFERWDGMLVAIAGAVDTFSSSDAGVSWRSEGTSMAVGPGGAYAIDGLIVRSGYESFSGASEIVMQSSTDRGATWQRLDPTLFDFISLGDAIFAVGVDGTGNAAMLAKP